MRVSKQLAWFAICVLAFGLCASASQNKFGVADTRTIELVAPTWVGDTLLPSGDYKVVHTMEGQDHIMVFSQLNTHKPAEARVKCQLVNLAKKADQDQLFFTTNPAHQRVLHVLVFHGDSAQHVF
ncbi:MAG TPA: hypothetical protein VMB18_16005 [Terriglobales bacterium]|jgi:hypothetical protein|nr:hypothetical protein [Terriglobales bacterium]